MIGTWCEYAHMHYLDCVILPDDAVPEEYAGSVVNAITPYAFLQQVSTEGHKAYPEQRYYPFIWLPG
jgi:NADPH:quinone reductase-like Zn-dependent oxidoreductase